MLKIESFKALFQKEWLIQLILLDTTYLLNKSSIKFTCFLKR